MSVKLNIAYKENYLLLEISKGAISVSELNTILLDLAEKAKIANLHILINSKIPESPDLSIVNCLDFVKIIDKSSYRNKFAIVTSRELNHENLKFIRTAGINRGIDFKFFNLLEDAIEWIEENKLK